jgi:Domain of unknown function (DUF4150)/GHH signature containing HNH/Endo VII superfamily nuclease toxin  2
MANEVYANGNEIACKAAAGKSAAAMPDTCLSPPSPPAGPVPIPYPNTSYASDTTKGTTTVMISGQEVMMKDQSTFKKSTGDEAATKSLGMGVVTHCIQGEASFVAWSMDVHFEGANVDRHLDIMMHNEQCTPANTPTWPYLDSAALGAGSPCNKKAPNDYANQVAAKCSTPPEDCKTPACCKARKCMLVPGVLEPKSARKCCGKQTPHHIIPVMDHYTEENVRTTDMSEKARKALLPRGSKTYDEDKAASVCVSGQDHRNPRKQHGRIGRGFAFMRNELLRKTKKDTYTYEEVAQPAADMVGNETKCNPDCIKAQMDSYHNKSSKGPLRKSRQPEKHGGPVYRATL